MIPHTHTDDKDASWPTVRHSSLPPPDIPLSLSLLFATSTAFTHRYCTLHIGHLSISHSFSILLSLCSLCIALWLLPPGIPPPPPPLPAAAASLRPWHSRPRGKHPHFPIFSFSFCTQNACRRPAGLAPSAPPRLDDWQSSCVACITLSGKRCVESFLVIVIGQEGERVS